MSDMLERYNAFIHQMWQKNCIERDEWCLPQLSKEDYVSQNGTFLEDTFWMQEVGNKVWSVKESDYVEASSAG